MEASPPPGQFDFGKMDYVTAYNAVDINTGGIAGLAVANAANPLAVVLNPNVLSAVKGKRFADSDRRVVKYRPPQSSNLATMMGLGIDQNTFNRAKEFINQYFPNTDSDFTNVSDRDDPEQSTSLSWQKLNAAVSNYNSQNVKDMLTKNNLFRGTNQSNYEQGMSDQYQRFNLGKRAQKAVEDTVTNILGKPSRFRGKNVSGYIRQLSQGQKNRMANTWSQNPDQSGKIKLRNEKIVNEAFTKDLVTGVQAPNLPSQVTYMDSDLVSNRQVPQNNKPQIKEKPKTNQYKTNKDKEKPRREAGTTLQYHPADFNEDGFVDASDYGALLTAFGPVTPETERFDLNGDGVINNDDLGLLLSAWGDQPPEEIDIPDEDGGGGGGGGEEENPPNSETEVQNNIPYWMSGKTTNVDTLFGSKRKKRKNN